MAVMVVAVGIAFAVWVGVASIMMLIRPEVDRSDIVRTVFAH